MVRTIRGVIVLLAVALLGFASALPSSAAPSSAPSESVTTTGCGESESGYPAPCLFSVQVAPACVENVPEVAYQVLGTPPGVTTVSATFQNAGGQSISLANLPLSGKIVALLKAGVLIHFAAGPQAQADAVFPGATVACGPQVLDTPTPTPTAQVLVDTPSPTPSVTTVSQVLAEPDPTSGSAVLSATGSNDAPLLGAAIAFIVIGAAAVTLVTISRRRRNA